MEEVFAGGEVDSGCVTHGGEMVLVGGGRGSRGEVGLCDFQSDGACEGVFEESELFASFELFAGLGRGVFGGGVDVEGASAEAEVDVDVSVGSGVEGVGGAEEGEEDACGVCVGEG